MSLVSNQTPVTMYCSKSIRKPIKKEMNASFWIALTRVLHRTLLETPEYEVKSFEFQICFSIESS